MHLAYVDCRCTSESASAEEMVRGSIQDRVSVHAGTLGGFGRLIRFDADIDARN